jgi:hypothetical protein
MDVIEGRKEVRFDLTEEGHYGEAGENGTIHLNRRAVTERTAEGLIFFASTVAREGVLIDSGLRGDDRMTAYARELGATGIQTMILEGLSSNFGVNVYESDSEYSKVANLLAYSTERGDLSMFNWESGNSLWINELGLDIRNQRNNRSREGDKKLGDVMCNVTALSIALVMMPGNEKEREVASMGSPGWIWNKRTSQLEDELEEKRKQMSLYLVSKYGTDARTMFSTLIELAIASGVVQRAEYRPDEYGVQWIYMDGAKAFHYWGKENKNHPTLENMKKFFFKLKNEMRPGDQLIVGGQFNVVYEDGTRRVLGHIVYVQEITEDGLRIVDPYGGYVKYAMQNYGDLRYNSVEENLYRRNDRAKEFGQEFTSYYFLPWEKVYEHGVGRNATLLLRPVEQKKPEYDLYRRLRYYGTLMEE